MTVPGTPIFPRSCNSWIITTVTRNRGFYLRNIPITTPELRLFIEKNGGNVVRAAAMSLGGHGNKIAPYPEIIKSLVDKYGADTLSLFLQEFNLYGGNYKALTNPEAFALRRASSLDEARDRILAARQAGRSHLVSRSHQETKPQTSIDPIESYHRRKSHW
jgi:hypothetical protein